MGAKLSTHTIATEAQPPQCIDLKRTLNLLYQIFIRYYKRGVGVGHSLYLCMISTMLCNMSDEK